jgi:hypothetical protein
MEQFKLDFFRKDHEMVNISFITLSKKSVMMLLCLFV